MARLLRRGVADAHSGARSSIERAHASLRSGASLGGVSGDPTIEALRRLRILCIALTFGPAVMIAIVMAIAPPGSPQRDARGITLGLIGGEMLISLVVFRVLGDARIRPEARLHVGFFYQVVVALIIAVERHLLPWPPGAGFRDISPVGVVILVFAAFVPNEPRRTLAVSLVSAAMESVGLGVAFARGVPLPPPAQIAALCAPPFLGAVVATLISRVVYGLAQGAKEARRLGSYELVERLGEGGMGEVWKARHALLARPAAIKLIRAGALGELGARRRFEREAQATAALQSPHTIQLFDFGVADDGTFYYVMELLDGLDLERLVRAHGRMPPERAVHVLRQVCASLDEAHHAGLVHRDIKPANVYLCRYARELDFVKVLDFGLVKHRAPVDAAENAPTVSLVGTIAGTPAFLAPEMAIGDSEVDARADVYAVGCLAYWLLTGELVFEGKSPMQMVIDHARTAPTPPSKRIGTPLPPDLERLVLDCLEKSPAARPASAEAVAARLAALDVAPWTHAEAAAWWSAHGDADASHDALAPTEAATPAISA